MEKLIGQFALNKDIDKKHLAKTNGLEEIVNMYIFFVCRNLFTAGNIVKL